MFTLAVSRAGAMGIAQFMPGTAAARGLDDPFDPFKAIPAAARYLADYAASSAISASPPPPIMPALAGCRLGCAEPRNCRPKPATTCCASPAPVQRIGLPIVPMRRRSAPACRPGRRSSHRPLPRRHACFRRSRHLPLRALPTAQSAAARVRRSRPPKLSCALPLPPVAAAASCRRHIETDVPTNRHGRSRQAVAFPLRLLSLAAPIIVALALEQW